MPILTVALALGYSPRFRSTQRRPTRPQSKVPLRQHLRSTRPVAMAFQELGPLLFPPMTALNLGLLALPAGQLLSGPMEASGVQQMKYSKFAGGAGNVPSKVGMLIIYGPALLVSTLGVANALQAVGGEWVAVGRPGLVAALLFTHFLKRELEVLFLHKYSGKAALADCAVVSFFYGATAWAISSWTLQVPPDAYNALSPLAPILGTLLFSVGIAGNFYHHRLLANLRGQGSKQYKVPNGGLFNFVTCPHFFFELLVWFGIAVASQQVGALGTAVGMSSYLTGRALATRKWYIAKMEDYPRDRKTILPFLF